MDETAKSMGADLEKEIDRGLRLYRKPGIIDNLLYNWGTGLAILFNAFATAVPSNATNGLFWAGKAAGIIATAWIAIDRLLAFGARWHFSLSQQARFNAVRLQLVKSRYLPADQQLPELARLTDEIAELFKRDEEFPGIVTSFYSTASNAGNEGQGRMQAAS